jgi:hypothetical protein
MIPFYQRSLKMEGFGWEFLIWLIIVLIVFWIVNNYIGLKRFASAIVAFLIASIAIFVLYNGNLLAEVFVTATFLILALFGLSAVFRSIRSDFEKPSVNKNTEVASTASRSTNE